MEGTIRLMVTSAFIAILISSAYGCVCDGQPEGHVCTIGCRQFSRCIGGIVITVDCVEGTVVDINLMRCVDAETAPAPCGRGSEKNCTGRADGNYADQETGCTTYYNCAGGRFNFRQLCPDGLVFNEENGNCDWPYNTCPPCGTGAAVQPPCDTPNPCECTNQPNGTICLEDCTVRLTCINGDAFGVACTNVGTVVDPATGTCKPISEVPPPCGTQTPTSAAPTTEAQPTEAPTTEAQPTEAPSPVTGNIFTTISDGCDCGAGGDRVCAVRSCNEVTECLSGVRIETTCSTNLVVNRNWECDLISSVCPPCGTNNAADCT